MATALNNPTGFVLLASTGAAGTPLTAGTPVFLTWTAPNDGNLHRIQVFSALNVTSSETGGAVGLGWTQPDGSVIAAAAQLFAAGLGISTNWTPQFRLVKAGTSVTVAQTSGLSGGAAVLYAEIWGS